MTGPVDLDAARALFDRAFMEPENRVLAFLVLAEVGALRGEARERSDGEKAWHAAYLKANDENKRLRDLARRFRAWDMLDAASDGPYWKREIDDALGGEA